VILNRNPLVSQNLSSTADKATLASKLRVAVESDLFGPSNEKSASQFSKPNLKARRGTDASTSVSPSKQKRENIRQNFS
jgi:hypothetical protein